MAARLSDLLDRGRPRGGRLAGLGPADGAPRQARPARGRRRVRDAAVPARARGPRGSGQRDPREAEPGGHPLRHDRHRARGVRRGVRRRDEPPQRRDGGHDDRGPRRRARHGADQERRALPLGARREVQPPPADRGGTRPPRALRAAAAVSLGEPVLVAPDPAPERGLPRWLLPVALAGVAMIVVSILPAFVARRRLERAVARQEREIRERQERTERIARDRQALATDPYVHERALAELLAPGPRVALPRTPAPAAPR